MTTGLGVGLAAFLLAAYEHENREHDGRVCIGVRLELVARLAYVLDVCPDEGDPADLERFGAWLSRRVGDLRAVESEHLL